MVGLSARAVSTMAQEAEPLALAFTMPRCPGGASLARSAAIFTVSSGLSR